MASVTQHPSTVEYLEKLRAALQRDTALRCAAKQAASRYAGEQARIDRGLVLALNGAVTLHPNGTASVQSASDAEVIYTVNGHCDCHDASRAPAGRCKHRWAKALVKKATTVTAAQRYYATYYAPDGTDHQGIATITEYGWLFVGDHGEKPLYPALQAMALGGNMAIADTKRAEEEAAGGLVAIICGYGQ